MNNVTNIQTALGTKKGSSFLLKWMRRTADEVMLERTHQRDKVDCQVMQRTGEKEAETEQVDIKLIHM